MLPLSDVDLGWLAGIIEGEGCLHAPKAASGKRYPKVSVEMTDHDVILRLQAITGVGNVHGPSMRGGRHENGWKPIFCWQVGRQEDVRAVMTAIYPLMGGRRRAKLDEVMLLQAQVAPSPSVRWNAPECRNGHPRSEPMSHDGGCRQCRRDRNREHLARVRQAAKGG